MVVLRTNGAQSEATCRWRVGGAFRSRRTLGGNGREIVGRRRDSLIQLHLNGQDDERGYSRLLRQKLASAGGRGPERHQIEDPRGYASLWR
jgi:hypothetical protein